MENHRVRIEVTGKVQGVFYRASTLQIANKLGLTGNIRNLPNGNVRIIAEGNEKNLKELYEWCKIGPDLSIVNSVEIIWEKAENNFSSFEIV